MAHALGNTELLSHSRHPSVDAFRVVICWCKSVLFLVYLSEYYDDASSTLSFSSASACQRG